MPPVAKKGKKGKKGKKNGDNDAVITALQKEVEQLKQTVQDLQDQNRQEQKERNFFQLERDKIHTLFEVAQAQLQEARAAIRSKDREMEELVENHQIAVRVYQQKIKDSLYGHQQTATQLKFSSETQLRAEEDFHRTREDELLHEIDSLKLKIKENQLTNQDVVKSLKQGHQNQISILRQQNEDQIWAMQRDFEYKLKEALSEAEMRRKAEIQEIETMKNNQINNLVQRHGENFQKMKEYYQAITTSNLELIKSLKDEVEEMKKRQLANEQLMYDIAQENRRLTEPLQKALAELEDLRKKLQDVQKQNTQLSKSHTRAEELTGELRRLEWECNELKTALRDTAKERDELRARFEAAVQDVSQRGAFREVILERRINALEGEVESKQASLAEFLAAHNFDQGAAGAVQQQLDNVLEGKNRNIRELSFELARVMRLYNEALRVFRGKMTQAGVECGDMDGFRPFEVRDDL